MLLRTVAQPSCATVSTLPRISKRLGRFEVVHSSNDGRSRAIRLRDSKNNEPRSISISGDVHKIIERRWRAREYTKHEKDKVTRISELVFHRPGRSIKSFFKSWNKACDAAKCPGRLFHDLRRSAIRDMRRAGVSEDVAMQVSGHKGRSMFQRYNTVSNDDKKHALTLLEAFRATRSAASN